MEIDLGQIYKITAAGRQELKNIDRKMRHAVVNAANYEKATHTYINRTGNLEKSTKGIVRKSGDEFDAYLVMDMYYASFVNNLGYSNIDEAYKMMIDDIENYLSSRGF